MSKFKIMYAGIIISCVLFAALVYVKIIRQQQYQEKVGLAHDLRKVLGPLMMDLVQASEKTILNAPADGQWHHRLAFSIPGQGALEYTIREEHLWRRSPAKQVLIANHIHDLSIRRNRKNPGILEVRIEAQNHVSLVSNLKLRLQE